MFAFSECDYLALINMDLCLHDNVNADDANMGENITSYVSLYIKFG